MQDASSAEAASSEAASVGVGVQRCSKCDETKPLAEFAVRSNRENGRQSQCKVCVNAWAAEYRKKTRPKPTIETRQCETCESNFEWSSMHPKQVYCSKACYRPKGTRLQRLRRKAPEGSWACSACFEIKPLADFAGGKKRSRCKPCAADYQRQYLAANGERVRETQRTSRHRNYPMNEYGVTREEYDAGLAQAKVDGCPICLRMDVTFHFDHCHASGLARAWLCADCNKALGMFADDPERLQRAIDYLRRF